MLIDIESLQGRLFKVCYVPAACAGLPRLLFAIAINNVNEANKAGNKHRVCATVPHSAVTLEA